MLPRPLKLKLSPSPESLPPPANKGPKRRQQTQASQGDAVLINFLAGQNLPDVATRAGEEPLNSASQSESGEPGSPMDVGDENIVEKKGSSLVQTAQDALPLIDESAQVPINDRTRSPKIDDSRRSLSRLHTQDLIPSSRDQALSDAPGSRIGEEKFGGHVTSNPRGSEATLGTAQGAGKTSPRRSPPPSSRPSHLMRRSSSTASPLRKYAIPASEASSMETLPAMQTSPQSLSAKSPNSQQTLPPLHAHFGPLVEGLSTNDNDHRSNGMNPNRQHFPLLDNTVNSPSLGSLSTRPGQFSSPQSRLNGPLPPPYPPSQPSSVNTFNEGSPRETYRPSSDPTSMSPPGRFGPNQFYPNARTPKNDEMTPLSAESYQSSTSYGTDTLPNSDHVDSEGSRPILPPPGNAQSLTGSFKCEHEGCSAQPFQTQYLLK